MLIALSVQNQSWWASTTLLPYMRGDAIGGAPVGFDIDNGGIQRSGSGTTHTTAGRGGAGAGGLQSPDLMQDMVREYSRCS